MGPPPPSEQTKAVRGASDLRQVASLPIQQTYSRTLWLGQEVGRRCNDTHVNAAPEGRVYSHSSLR
jgi:hypothetical protein